MRILPALLAAQLTQAVTAQCGPYMHHPVWPDTVGLAYLNPFECGALGEIDACLWDNGATDWSVDGLGVGAHHVVVLQGGAPVDTLHFQIQQLEWLLHLSPVGGPAAAGFYATASLPYCGTSIFNHHHCAPDPDSTALYLLQDGVPIDSLWPVSCMAGFELWNGLPFGASYQLHLIDHGACGSFGYSQLVLAYSCEGALLDALVEPAGNGAGGSIAILEVVPGPAAALPPPSPLTGVFQVRAWPSMEPAAGEQTGSSASWEDLPAGTYHVSFLADSLCAPVDTILTVEAVMGLAGREGRPAPQVFPQPVEDLLHWTGPLPPMRITDAQGRIVADGLGASPIDASALAPGYYVLQFAEGSRRAFIKR